MDDKSTNLSNCPIGQQGAHTGRCFDSVAAFQNKEPYAIENEQSQPQQLIGSTAPMNNAQGEGPPVESKTLSSQISNKSLTIEDIDEVIQLHYKEDLDRGQFGFCDPESTFEEEYHQTESNMEDNLANKPQGGNQSPMRTNVGTMNAASNVGQQQNAVNGPPYVRIIEQPARSALRFRYECEGRSAGSIPGASSTSENKTYPTIQVCNYRGQAVVVVSCVTKDFPYRPHPHNLVGKEGCKKGVCTVVINNPDMVCSFTSLGIQCVKRKDIEESLKLREAIKVDPFRTGFAHKNQASNIDLNVVRLCFQVFVEGPEKDKFTIPLPPVVSDPIYDKKAMSELIITKLSHCSAPVTGGKEIILLCDRVTKDDIQVRFYEEVNGQLVWEGLGEFQPSDVHKQVAICFRTPRYYNEGTQQPVLVQLQLRRPSDGCLSDPRPFQFLPREVDPEGLQRKRQKIEEGCLDRYLREPLFSNVQSALAQPSPVPSPALQHQMKPMTQPKLEPSTTPTPVQMVSSSQSLTSQPNELIHVPRMASQLPMATAFPGGSSTAAWTGTEASFMSSKPTAQLRLSTPSHPTQNESQTEQSLSAILQRPPLNERQMQDMQGDMQAPMKIQAASSMMAQSVQSQQPMAQNQIQPTGMDEPQSSDAEVLTVRLDSLDLDIDPSDLMGDINFNSMTMMMMSMDSGSNLNFNNQGNNSNNNNNQVDMDTRSLLDGGAATSNMQTLTTPQILESLVDSPTSNRNIFANPAQMARLQNELQMQTNQSSSNQS